MPFKPFSSKAILNRNKPTAEHVICIRKFPNRADFDYVKFRNRDPQALKMIGHLINDTAAYKVNRRLSGVTISQINQGVNGAIPMVNGKDLINKTIDDVVSRANSKRAQLLKLITDKNLYLSPSQSYYLWFNKYVVNPNYCPCSFIYADGGHACGCSEPSSSITYFLCPLVLLLFYLWYFMGSLMCIVDCIGCYRGRCYVDAHYD
jgi:hypothetical protein